jgi:hypothetical protein
MKWHSYEERYLLRRVDGHDHDTVHHLQSPEFAVGQSELRTHDARLKSRPGETVWLLSAAPSRTYVAYQPQPHLQLPIALETPIAKVTAERFPFGKLAATRAPDGTLELNIDAGFRPFWSGAHWRAKIWQELGTHPSEICVIADAPKIAATINGDELPVLRKVRDGQAVWVLDPYARLPRVRDRVGGNRPTNLVPRQ